MEVCMSCLIRNLLIGLFVCIGITACGGGGSGSSAPSPAPTSQPAASSSSASVAQASQSSISSAPLPSAASSSSTATSSTSSSQSDAVGLDSRPSNATCLAPAVVNDNSGVISWALAFENLPVVSKAVGLFQLPGDDTHWYVLRQSGLIWQFDNSASANKFTEVLNIDERVDGSDSEMGLLGVAPHPDFVNNHFVFLYYTSRNASNEIESHVARYTVKNDGVFDPNSELIILSITRPYTNHVGGQLAFDQQGYLNIASGDGGSGGDPFENGQNLNVLLGKILRIDINNMANGKNYAIPVDNPFINTANAKPEIWAYGLRNPWRFSFDKLTNELWAGDVGQNTWEEINLVTRGGNYGWGDMEGDSCYKSRPNCSTANKIKPILPISQTTGACSVMGGFVYRGNTYPAAYGKYFYTDYCEHTMRSITRATNGALTLAEYGSTANSIVSFAQDNHGELFAIGYGNAGQQIYKMQATGSAAKSGVMANKLSETGCVSNTRHKDAASGLIPYVVNNALWSDGADKQRFLSLPDNTQVTVTGNGDFNFPIGSVLMKHFKFGEKFIETRLFAHGELGWQGFSYEWNDAQTDATLLTGAKDKTVDNLVWHFPSPGQCMECHTTVAGFSLGLETKQLNGGYLYSATQKTANQLTTLAHIGIFAAPLSNAQKSEKLVGLNDAQATLQQKARSYLHSNCSNCHQPDGPTPVKLDLRFSTPLGQMNICNVAPTAGDLGMVNSKILVVGDPSTSILVKRMQALDDTQMPPLGRSVVDTQAVQVVSDWIASLAACE
jgi:uncharacterized repeat protein (TIGR03806 family)